MLTLQDRGATIAAGGVSFEDVIAWTPLHRFGVAFRTLGVAGTGIPGSVSGAGSPAIFGQAGRPVPPNLNGAGCMTWERNHGGTIARETPPHGDNWLLVGNRIGLRRAGQGSIRSQNSGGNNEYEPKHVITLPVLFLCLVLVAPFRRRARFRLFKSQGSLRPRRQADELRGSGGCFP